MTNNKTSTNSVPTIPTTTGLTNIKTSLSVGGRGERGMKSLRPLAPLNDSKHRTDIAIVVVMGEAKHFLGSSLSDNRRTIHAVLSAVELSTLNFFGKKIIPYISPVNR